MRSKPLTEKQFEENFRQMFTRLYYLSLDITGEAEVARDIVQECYSTVWRSHRDLSAKDLPAYMFVSVRNASMHRAIEQKKIQDVPIDMLSDKESSSDDDWREVEERVGELERLLRQLPEKSRKMLSLRFRQEMSYRDIANTLDVSIENVRKTLYRSLKLLRMQINVKK